MAAANMSKFTSERFTEGLMRFRALQTGTSAVPCPDPAVGRHSIHQIQASLFLWLTFQLASLRCLPFGFHRGFGVT